MATLSLPRPTSPPRVRPLAQWVYDRIHACIADGTLDPAQRLTESDLAALLGVSRTPVREALVRLRREGLIGVPFTQRLTHGDLEEIMEIRLLLEPHLAARAAARATPACTARLRDVVEREQGAIATPSVEAFAVANHEFRICLLDIAGNRRLAELASRYDSQIQALRRLSLSSSESRWKVVAGHNTVVAAIERGDAVGAADGMRRLMQDARDRILTLVPTPHQRPVGRKESPPSWPV